MQQIIKELETRKEHLISHLKTKKDIIEIEKQHQIYGAIKELDYVIKFIEQEKEENYEEAEEQQEIILNNNNETETQTTTAKKVGFSITKFKSPLRIKFSKE